MMSEEEAFLRAICENPDEDTPRLVFADWLTERGGAVNIAWANAIRAQIWLAHGAIDVATTQRSRLFESAYGQAKMDERLGIPQGIRVGSWERGFPTCATGDFRQLHDNWQRLAFRIPLRQLRIFEVSESGAAEFVMWPALSVLQELELSAPWRVPTACNIIPALADCEALHGLKVLDLHDADLNDATVLMFLDSPHFKNLHKLRLDILRNTPVISQAVKARLVARFGEEVFDDPIPF